MFWKYDVKDVFVIFCKMESYPFFDVVWKLVNIFFIRFRENQSLDALSGCCHGLLFYTADWEYFAVERDLSSHSNVFHDWCLQCQTNKSCCDSDSCRRPILGS